MAEYLGSAAALDHSVVLMLDGPGNGYYHQNPAKGCKWLLGDHFEFMGTTYVVDKWPTDELVAIETGYNDEYFDGGHDFRL